MDKKDQQFYLVREDVLPEAMQKTLQAKRLIERGKVDSIADAVQMVDLSRSAFYKYRDTVFPFHTMVKERIITLFFSLGRPLRDIVAPFGYCRFSRMQCTDDPSNDPASRKSECHVIT